MSKLMTVAKVLNYTAYDLAILYDDIEGRLLIYPGPMLMGQGKSWIVDSGQAVDLTEEAL